MGTISLTLCYQKIDLKDPRSHNTPRFIREYTDALGYTNPVGSNPEALEKGYNKYAKLPIGMRFAQK